MRRLNADKKFCRRRQSVNNVGYARYCLVRIYESMPCDVDANSHEISNARELFFHQNVSSHY
jgi:hypothetical protein